MNLDLCRGLVVPFWGVAGLWCGFHGSLENF